MENHGQAEHRHLPWELHKIVTDSLDFCIPRPVSYSGHLSTELVHAPLALELIRVVQGDGLLLDMSNFWNIW